MEPGILTTSPKILGTRLARFGYTAATLPSTTYEEAPAQIGPWLKQRTRWFKGWMRTAIVHMRQPVLFVREFGLVAFAAFHLTLAGTVLAALVQPYLLIVLPMMAFGDLSLLTPEAGVSRHVFMLLHAASAISGYGAAVVLAWVGLKRRGLRRFAWILLLMPLHWVLLSVAAWRALLQLVRHPYYWEKTPHGLARTSRRRNARNG